MKNLYCYLTLLIVALNCKIENLDAMKRKLDEIEDVNSQTAQKNIKLSENQEATSNNSDNSNNSDTIIHPSFNQIMDDDYVEIPNSQNIINLANMNNIDADGDDENDFPLEILCSIFIFILDDIPQNIAHFNDSHMRIYQNKNKIFKSLVRILTPLREVNKQWLKAVDTIISSNQMKPLSQEIYYSINELPTFFALLNTPSWPRSTDLFNKEQKQHIETTLASNIIFSYANTDYIQRASSEPLQRFYDLARDLINQTPNRTLEKVMLLNEMAVNHRIVYGLLWTSDFFKNNPQILRKVALYAKELACINPGPLYSKLLIKHGAATTFAYLFGMRLHSTSLEILKNLLAYHDDFPEIVSYATQAVRQVIALDNPYLAYTIAKLLNELMALGRYDEALIFVIKNLGLRNAHSYAIEVTQALFEQNPEILQIWTLLSNESDLNTYSFDHPIFSDFKKELNNYAKNNGIIQSSYCCIS